VSEAAWQVGSSASTSAGYPRRRGPAIDGCRPFTAAAAWRACTLLTLTHRQARSAGSPAWRVTDRPLPTALQGPSMCKGTPHVIPQAPSTAMDLCGAAEEDVAELDYPCAAVSTAAPLRPSAWGPASAGQRSSRPWNLHPQRRRGSRLHRRGSPLEPPALHVVAPLQQQASPVVLPSTRTITTQPCCRPTRCRQRCLAMWWPGS